MNRVSSLYIAFHVTPQNLHSFVDNQYIDCTDSFVHGRPDMNLYRKGTVIQRRNHNLLAKSSNGLVDEGFGRSGGPW